MSDAEVLDRGDEIAEPVVAEKIEPAEVEAALGLDGAKNEASEGESEPKKGKGAIPVDRHKAILDRERARADQALAELQALKEASQAQQISQDLNEAETRVGELESEYTKALADGEIEKATRIMAELRRTERGITEARAQATVAAADARAVEQVRFDVVRERIESEYPELQYGGDEYDEAKTQEVLDLTMAFRAKGELPSQALQKAVKYVMGVTTRAQERAVDSTPRVKAEDVAAQRKADAVKRNIDAAKRTPASTAGVGLDSDKLGGGLSPNGIMKMSQEEFAKLSDDDLAKLRGDFL